MYLCALKRSGKSIPSQLPEVIRNEVSSMVDIISFGVPDDRPQAAPRSNVPNFSAPEPPSRQDSKTPTQAQPGPSNSALLGMNLAQQQTGFPGMQPQPTGFQSQQTGFQPQQTGFQPQQTGMPSLQVQQTGFGGGIMPQQTGYGQTPGIGNVPPMPPMPTGMSSLAPGGFLQSQPTGKPGQWGFVNAPASSLPGLEALKQQMMPQPGREQFSMKGLEGNAKIPWAITKIEKQMYDQLFESWDGLGKGLIGGDVAIEVFGQSGLPKNDLMQIWTLADPSNRGKLNKDEFAVAMHLVGCLSTLNVNFH